MFLPLGMQKAKNKLKALTQTLFFNLNYNFMNFSNLLKAFFLSAIISISFVACEEDEAETYEVRLRNGAYSEALGVVPTKYEITEFTIGGTTVEDIAYGEFSDYFSVESDKEYSLSISYDIYLYNADTQAWQFDRSDSDDLGTETWGTGECKPQRITITIKELLGVAAGANYDVYCDE